MTTILNGLLGGAIAALIATLAAHLVSGQQRTKTAGSAAGTESTASRWRSHLVPVVYGSAAGGVLVALELFVLRVLAVPPSISEALTVAVTWSVVLLVAALVIWRFALGSRADRPYPKELVVYHVVFGFGLGIWIRMTWIT